MRSDFSLSVSHVSQDIVYFIYYDRLIPIHIFIHVFSHIKPSASFTAIPFSQSVTIYVIHHSLCMFQLFLLDNRLSVA